MLRPWLILSVAALSVIFLGGKRRAFGIFVAQLHSEFTQTSLAELNWVGDSYAAVGYLTTTISTSLILKFGRRYWLFQFLGASFILVSCITSAYVPNIHWLFLTHTAIHGIGSSLILATAGLVVNEYFDKDHPYHVLATTLVSGGSVASIVFVQFYAYLIEYNGWRVALVILGIIYFVVLLLGSTVFVRNPNKVDYESQTFIHLTSRHLTFGQLSLLVLWLLDRVITSIVTYGILLNLTDYVYRKNDSLQSSAILTKLFAVGEASTYIIGAVTTALTRKFFKDRLKYVLSATSFVLALSLTCWEFLHQYQVISRLLSYVSGFCLGPSITFLFPAGEEMTRLPGAFAYPFSLAGMGLGMAVSPVLTAMVAQKFKYRWFFLIQGGIMYIKVICLITAMIILRFMKRSGLHMVLHSEDVTEAGGYDNTDVIISDCECEITAEVSKWCRLDEEKEIYNDCQSLKKQHDYDMCNSDPTETSFSRYASFKLHIY